jgi:hypothetical protein
MPEKENRTPERLKAHYLIEKELADRLRRADKAARQGLYAQVYAELRRLVSDHPDWWPWANTAARAWSLRNQMALLKRFLRPDTVLLEGGAGDCRLAIEAAKRVAQVYALDVTSPERRSALPLPHGGQEPGLERGGLVRERRGRGGSIRQGRRRPPETR